MNPISLIQEIGIAGFLDIFIMTLLIYTLLVWFMKTRAAFVLTGIIIVAGIYLLTRQFNLALTAAVFEKFFAIILIAVVVIFQEELRHMFERIAVWSFKSPLVRSRSALLSRKEVDVLVRTVTELARERIGALIVIRGKDLIARHLGGGVDLNGELSEPVLRSIFDPHSIGHDGAVIIEGTRISQFGCHLPLSKNVKTVAKGGTRHAAALGLAERSDALCLVVSEERGSISVAQDGDIESVKDPEHLAVRLERFFQEINPKEQRKPLHGFLRRNTREKIIAFVLAIALWVVLVGGSEIAFKTYSVPIQFEDIGAEWKIVEQSPQEIKVTLRAPKRSLFFLRRDNINLTIPLIAKPGAQRIWISNGDFQMPTNLELQTVVPREVSIRLEPKPKDSEKKQDS